MSEITASLITDSLFHHFNTTKGYTYQLCNAYVFRWESDFFCLAKSGYSYEIEVKVSRSDYFADFSKKRKHRILKRKGKYHVNRDFVCFDPTEKLVQIAWKNYDYEQFDTYRYSRPYSNISIVKISEVRPNKFIYAVPAGLITPDEVPDYAGLIYSHFEGERFKGIEIVKNPPALHREKKDFTKILLKKYYWAYLNSLDQKRAGKNFEFPNER